MKVLIFFPPENHTDTESQNSVICFRMQFPHWVLLQKGLFVFFTKIKEMMA